MRRDTTEKDLKLIVLLLDGNDYTIDDLCEKSGMSRRNFYYTLEFLKAQGFIVYKTDRRYFHIDRRSPFVAKIADSVQFSTADLLTIRNMLGMFGNGNQTVNALIKKLDSAYDFASIVNTPEARHHASIVAKINNAMQHKKMMRIIGYSSPHSHTTKDRIVEPFLLMNDNREVRCNEIATGENKTFKIARMDDVEVLDASWVNEGKHRQVFTDIFMFSGEEHHTIKLSVGQLTRDLFLEEYPQAARCVTKDDTNHMKWIIELEVCDYRGIGRFVLGLYDDIIILADEAFKAYIRQHIILMYNKSYFEG